MLEDAQHFTIRLEGNTWQVNVPGEDWIDANSLRDAETIAAAPLLMREVTTCLCVANTNDADTLQRSGGFANLLTELHCFSGILVACRAARVVGVYRD